MSNQCFKDQCWVNCEQEIKHLKSVVEEIDYRIVNSMANDPAYNLVEALLLVGACRVFV